MSDEDTLFDAIDSRVRAALRPDEDACRRVVAGTLADSQAPSRPRWPLRLSVVMATALALILVVGGFEWRRRTSRAPSPSLTVTSDGAMLVVVSQDGRRWIVGPSLPPRRGNYVMVITE